MVWPSNDLYQIHGVLWAIDYREYDLLVIFFYLFCLPISELKSSKQKNLAHGKKNSRLRYELVFEFHVNF